MIQEILGYNFEIDKNGNEFPEKVDSLAEAIEKMSSDGFLLVRYSARIDDRVHIEQVEPLPYEKIAQLNQQQIRELIERRIKEKHNS